MKPHIIVTSKIIEAVIPVLEEHFTVHPYFDFSPDAREVPDDLKPLIKGIATTAIPSGTTDAHFAALPNLEIVSHYGVGTDTVDLEAARNRGIIVTNTPNVLNEDVADMGVILALSAIREVVKGDRFVRDGRWPKEIINLTRRVSELKVGILGLGNIGRIIAKRLEAFGMTIVYNDIKPVEGVSYEYYTDLLQMAKDVDVFFAMCPSLPSTRGIISKEVIEAIGPKGLFVNIARGALVDEAEMVAALKDGRLGYAALDVFVSEPNVPAELFELDNVILTPHTGSGTVETRRDIAQLTCDNLIRHFKGEPVLTPLW
ncbi:2-hydroxyacid dehydrogenase [Rhodobacteraceae bacterium RKSG542]|uniref:2-hydroxyacid dehydrogenase n=1 Tax=Pseudovibrio flavus TaxID=2529854 RepID=UPI0012BD1DB1|nr:2-hydroxyacid dehydrogenase [Pseudovibrio flavus]MTI18114.1 2-hydroxyacid dehydrogenase [Pseudovibrio flavus]